MPETQTSSFVPTLPAEPVDRAAPPYAPVVPPTRGDPPGPEDDRWGHLRSALGDRLPTALRGGVIDPAVRGALVLAAVAFLAAAIAVWIVWHGRAVPVAVSPPAAAARVGGAPAAIPAGTAPLPVSTARPTAPGPTTAAQVVVDVAGKVRRPGVVRLDQGARVVDALTRAGGALPGVDTTALPLARKLVDGEQILVTGVPAPTDAPVGAAPAAGGADAGATPSAASTAGGTADASSPVDLNTATVEELDALPGVGPVLAGRIVEYRTQHGGFTSVDQIRDVQGVGDKKAADLLPLVRV